MKRERSENDETDRRRGTERERVEREGERNARDRGQARGISI